MFATRIILGRSEASRPWKIGMLALMALMAAAAFAILLSPTALAAPARGNEPWLKIKCVETLVEEGEDFRLEVRKKHDSDWPHPTMRVFWYTDAITADETDYETSLCREAVEQRIAVRVGRDGTQLPHSG